MRPRLLLFVLCVAAVAWAIGQTAVIPALPALMEALDCGPSEVAWTMTGYLVPAAVLTPTLGRLGDLLGRRRVLLWTLSAFALGCFVSALGNSLGLVVLGRVLQGAAGGIFPLSFGIVREQLPAARVGPAIGLISALVGAGGGAGLLFGGLIIDHSSYHMIFLLGGVIAAAATYASWRLIPASRERIGGSVDVRGALLLGVGLALPLFAISRANEWGWLDVKTLGMVLSGCAVLAVWVPTQLRTAQPLADIPALMARPVLMTNLATLLIGFGVFGSFILTPQLVQAPTSTGYGLGMSATEAGLVLIPGALAMLVLGPVAGRMGGRVGSKVPLVIGALIATVGLVLLAFFHRSAWAVVGFAGLLYAGVGFCFAAMPNLIVEAVPARQTSEMTGFNALVRTTGSSLGTQVCAAILASGVIAGMPTESAYEAAFLVSALAAALAVLVGLAIPRSESGFRPGIAEEIGAAGPLAEPAYTRQ